MISFMEMLMSFILQGLAPAHTIITWVHDHGIVLLNWPAKLPELPIGTLCGLVKRRLRDTRYNNTDELLLKQSKATM